MRDASGGGTPDRDGAGRFARLLSARTIAVIGGGAWCAGIMGAARRIGYRGEIFAVHPEGKVIAGQQALRRLEDWPGPIDAAFVGINRHASVSAVAALAGLNAGGAVCFASGFTEALAEDRDGAELQAALVSAAGQMPLLGPNCYGFVNALDQVAIWPDQHGMVPLERGVAILTQSSNIAINLTMQRRGVPIAMMVTCGNMAQTSQAELARALLEDGRITAIGLHVEGFGDLRGWESLAEVARARGIPLVALKVGRSEQAQRATVSHTASLAGSDAGAAAFLDRLGIARVDGVAEFLEALKLLHCVGRLPSRRVASISCSGGEASLFADTAAVNGLELPPLSETQEADLARVLGPMVARSNPLDYHTYIWRDTEAMTQAWSAMTGPKVDLTLSIVDYPHTDASDWSCATEAAVAVRERTGRPFAVVSTLPELMPEATAVALLERGVVPMAGLSEAVAAISAVSRPVSPPQPPVLLAGRAAADALLSESEAKAELAAHGLCVPACREGTVADDLLRLARTLSGPLALKGVGMAHKSDSGGVRLGLAPEEVPVAAEAVGTARVLIEEMVTDGVAELLVGVVLDPAHGYVLTLGAGGVLTELLRDTVSLLVPSGPEAVRAALARLNCAPLLRGYRGRPGADIDAVCRAVDAVQSYVIANADTVGEVEINPLICTPDRAVAVDALIRKARA